MTKSQITATISEKTYKEWKKFCEENCINASQLIDKLIQEYLRKVRKGKLQKVKGGKGQ